MSSPQRRTYQDGRIQEDVTLNGLTAGEMPVWTSDTSIWGCNLDVYIDGGSGTTSINGGIIRAYANSGGVKSFVAQGRIRSAFVGGQGQYVLHAEAGGADNWEVTITPAVNVSGNPQNLSLVDNHVAIGMYGKEPAGSRNPLLAYINAPLNAVAFPPFPVSRIQTLLYKMWGENPTVNGNQFLMAFDSTTQPGAGAIPAIPPIPVAAGGTFSLALETPVVFRNGLWVALSTSDVNYQFAGLPAGGPNIIVGFQ